MKVLSIIIKNRQMRSSILIMLVSMYFTAILNYPFYHSLLKVSPFSWELGNYFILTIPVFIFFVLNAALQILSIPFIHKIIIPFLLVAGAAIGYQEYFYGIYFDDDQLTNVIQSNFSESIRMVTLPYIIFITLLGIIPAILYCYTKINYHRWYKEVSIRLLMIIISAIAITTIGKFYYKDYAAFTRNNKEMVNLIIPSNLIGAGIKLGKRTYLNSIPFTQLGINTTRSKLNNNRHITVIVVGETTRAQNWGLNGYYRQTTPQLSQRSDIINFPNTTSCGTATAISVPCMFSRYTRDEYNAIKASHESNLLDILQNAGINILWRDNDSGCKGVCDRVPNEDMTSLNLSEYCHNGECLDDILLKDIDDKLTNSKKDTLIILHTIGSHGPTYNERYTKEFEQFIPICNTNEIQKCSNEQLVNTYDNSILYIDHFLNKTIKLLEKYPNWESTLLYISDHGESLGEDGIYLHAAPYLIAPIYQTHVPMIIWFSPMWLKNEGINISCVKNSAKTLTFSQDNLFHTVFGIFNINNDIYNPNLDILSKCK